MIRLLNDYPETTAYVLFWLLVILCELIV